MNEVISSFLNRSFGYRKGPAMAKYLVGLIMAAVMVVILFAPAWAQSTPPELPPASDIKLECPPTNVRSLADCNRKCGTNCPPVKLTACKNSCSKKFGTEDKKYCRCLRKKVPLADWNRKKCITSCRDIHDMVACASVNNGAGGEIKSGEECPPCSDLDPQAVEVETEDGAYCAKHCPLKDKPIPLVTWEEKCPSCESKGLVLTDDGMNCAKRKKKADYVPAPVVTSVDPCEECETCNFLCPTIWDILLFVILILFAVYLYFDRRSLLEDVEGFKKKVKGALGQAVSDAELAEILAAQRDLMRLGESYGQLEAERNAALERKTGIENELSALDQEEPQLNSVLEDAKRALEASEASGPKQIGMADIIALKKNRGLETLEKAMEAGTELQAEYDANFGAELESLKQAVADAEAAVSAHAEARQGLGGILEEAGAAFTEADKAFRNVQGRIAEIQQKHSVLVPPPSSGGTPA